MRACKKQNNFCENTTIMIMAVCFWAACNQLPRDDGTPPPPLFPHPQSVEANPEGGYAINSITGDSIKPIINSLGDTVVTGVPIPAVGKVIHPDSVARPKSYKVLPKSQLPQKKAHTNRHKIPENIPTFPVDHSQLKTIKIGEGNQDFVLINSTGDTIPTGVPIPAIGKIVKAIHPKPASTLSPVLKDAALSNLRYFEVDQGLASSNVYSILEDKKGHLWFGTYQGVSRYDGQSLIHFTEKEGFANSIILSILEDKNGHLWFGSGQNGVIQFDGQTFTHFTENQGLPRNSITSILEDSNGHLWISILGGGVCKYDGASFVHYTVTEGLLNNDIRSIIEDVNGHLWFATGEGVCTYDGHSFIHFTVNEGLSSNNVYSMLEDKNGHLWFGTWEGSVSKYDGESFVHFAKKEGLPNHRIMSILEDRNGHIWFGTDGGGVSMYNGESFMHYTENEGLSNNYVRSILEDKIGNLWFGTISGGVNVYNEQSFIHFTEKDGLSDNKVLSILEDKNGHLWFGTVKGGVNIYDGNDFMQISKKEGLSSNTVMSILQDSNGNLWFGTSGGGVNKYDGKSFTHFTKNEGLSSNSVASILEDKNGNLWFGTWEGGVNKYDGKRFTHFTIKEGLSYHSVISIFEDSNGNLWFGTWGGGVTKYDGESFIHFTEKEGLSHNSVFSIAEDKNRNLWFALGGGGVSLYDGQTFTHYTEKEGLSDNLVWSSLIDMEDKVWISTIKGLNMLSTPNKPSRRAEKSYPVVFKKEDGLKGIDFLNSSAFIDSKNRAWWGSGKSLVMLDLNKFSVSDIIPQPTITRLDINEEFINYRDRSDSLSKEIRFTEVPPFENYPINLSLPYNKNHLTFHFVAIDWAAPHKIQYSYRMLGLNNRWSSPTKEAKTDYRNLSFGTFTFQVRAIGESGIWSDPFEYTFSIRPPWWHSWWAYGIYFLFLIIIGRRVHLFQKEKTIRQEREKSRERELAQAKEIEKAYYELEKTHMELKSTQTQLIQQEKLASLGQLTAGIAHEIKNPLNFVNNFSDVSIEMIDEAIDEVKAQGIAPQAEEDILEILVDIKSNLTKIHEHGSRADGIVKSMLMHSRGGSGTMEPTDLNALIREYVNLAYHGMRAGKNPVEVDIELDLDESIGEVPLINEDFSRVILNLCNNAFDACAERSRSTMRTAETQRIASLNVRTKKQKDTITIEIEDNGPGIPDDIKDKILQPFFTTKKGTEGTGLGLSITHDIVKAHGGEIIIESREDEGTKFIIILKL